MSRTMLIDATDPEETRVVVMNKSRLEEFDHESAARKQLKGNIYLAKVTRVEPSLQAAFVDYGGNRHGFLPFSEIHPDYYRIPIADREALKAEEAAIRDLANDDDDDEEEDGKRRTRGRRRSSARSRRRSVRSKAVDTEGAADEETSASPDGGVTTEFESLAADISEDADIHDPETAAREYAPDDEHMPADDEAESGDAGSGDGALEGAVDEDPAERADGENLEAGSGEVPGAGEHDEAEAHDAVEAHDEVEAEDHEEVKVETVGGDEADDEARRRAIVARRYKIQEVIKRRQVLLVQVTKEERGNKGAALTTYLSLAGRYCVLMPNTNKGGGISRKIANVTDRRRLKKIIADLEIPEGMAVIVRTAGSERSKLEIRRDYEYLLRLWNEIRENTLQSNAPSLIHEEANLIKRSIRDLYARDMDEIVVAGEDGYKGAKGFMRSLMPSHARKVQLHKDDDRPLFQKYGIEKQLDEMHSATVQLPSGGYIVLNSTEALVAIDVNSGRATKERHIEETALKTNLEAATEVARQLRLRDLAGLIVIDFIDMEESRHNRDVERRLKDAMRLDRARIQLGRISPFGLLELSRQRLRPSLFESSTGVCPTCAGHGFVRTTESSALHVLRMLEEEGLRKRGGDIHLTVPTAIGFYILNQKRERLLDIQRRHGFVVEVSADDSLVAPDFELTHSGGEAVRDDRRRSETRRDAETEDERDDDGRKRRRRRRSSRQRDEETPERRANGAAEPEEAEEIAEAETDAEADREARSDDDQDEGRTRSRRRRGRRGGRRRSRQRAESGQAGETAAEDAQDDMPEGDSEAADQPAAESGAAGAEEAGDGEETPRKRRSRRSRGGRGRRRTEASENGSAEAASPAEGDGEEAGDLSGDEADDGSQGSGPARRRRSPGKAAEAEVRAEVPAEVRAETAPEAEQPEDTRPGNGEAVPETAVPASQVPAHGGEAAPLNASSGNGDSHATDADEEPAPESPGSREDDESKEKRRGWWSRLLQ